MYFTKYIALFVNALMLLLCIVVYVHAATDNAEVNDKFVGSEACASCHQTEYSQWKGSHHEQAMQHANVDTVLGDFDNATYIYNKVTSRFFRKGDQYWVNTDGADGKLADFQVFYTFGVEPLQQYLIGLPGGRYQAFTIAWDTRQKSKGGQRWFHLYPDEKVTHKDVLHWTRASYNWNSRCAHCHSTDLHKNYDQATNKYKTAWSEISVGCESCHGAGVNHLAWLRDKGAGNVSAYKGFDIDLSQVSEWIKGNDSATASRADARAGGTSHPQINQCGQCHSRRTLLKEGVGTAHILQDYEPRLIDDPLYHVDGQIDDEVFVLGSFLQSKMHQQGVVCSNCHNPHTLKLKKTGNAVCTQCHSVDVFDTNAHHHHEKSSAGAQCVNCHMPEKSYMVVDPRRDHSLRIPRPDLSASLGTPNACNQCHTDKSIDWSLNSFKKWYPERVGAFHVGETFKAAREGTLTDSAVDNITTTNLETLFEISNDDNQPAYIRAAALMYLRNYPSREVMLEGIEKLTSKDAFIRLGALRQIGAVPSEQVIPLLWPLLSDEVRAIRFEAARLLVGVTHPDLSQGKVLDSTVDEYMAYLALNADSPGEQMQLGVMHVRRNELTKAEAAYQQALIIEPQYIPAIVNWADLHRGMGNDDKALPLLKSALALDSNNGDVNYALGLLHMRRKQLDLARNYLAVAVREAPLQPHYAYVYAVVLYESGLRKQAINVLTQGLEKHPGNGELTSALQSYKRVMGFQ